MISICDEQWAVSSHQWNFIIVQIFDWMLNTKLIDRILFQSQMIEYSWLNFVQMSNKLTWLDLIQLSVRHCFLLKMFQFQFKELYVCIKRKHFDFLMDKQWWIPKSIHWILDAEIQGSRKCYRIFICIYVVGYRNRCMA